MTLRMTSKRHTNLCRDLVREPMTNEEWEFLIEPQPIQFFVAERTCKECHKKLAGSLVKKGATYCKTCQRRFQRVRKLGGKL